MTCVNCGLCQEDITKLENLALDAKSRGVSKVASILERALDVCDCLRKLPKKDREYVRNIEGIMDSKEWDVDDRICLAKDAQRLVLDRRQSEKTTPNTPRGFRAQLEQAFPDSTTNENPEPIRFTSTFIRMYNASQNELCTETQEQSTKRLTLRSFTTYELDKNNKLRIPEPEPEPEQPDIPSMEQIRFINAVERRNLQEEWKKTDFPEICTEQCHHIQCPYRRLENFGKTCLQRLNEPNKKARP